MSKIHFEKPARIKTPPPPPPLQKQKKRDYKPPASEICIAKWDNSGTPKPVPRSSCTAGYAMSMCTYGFV
jgi:hypothetical protein